MKQIYHPYWNWEDFKAGMWRKVSPEDELSMLAQAIEFTGDHVKYGQAMLRVVDEWPITCEHNLSNDSLSRRAFIGHAAVCLELGIPEYIVRMAWGKLTDNQRIEANKVADIAIGKWEFFKYQDSKEDGQGVLGF